jgi:SAM-dependent methyltransferase
VNWPFFRTKQRASPLTPDLRRRIRASFEEAARDEEHFISTIDPRICHVRLILEYLGGLAGKRVLDIGCGKGRFARILAERFPSSEIWGLDLAGSMLRCAPAFIRVCAGSAAIAGASPAASSRIGKTSPRTACSWPGWRKDSG